MANRFFTRARRFTAAALCISSLCAVSAQAFSDVAPNAYYKSAVDWAAAEGITSGSDKDHFSPDSLCTRAQTVTFLWRANGSPAVSGNNPFSDVKTEDYFYDAVLWAVQNGITSGASATTFAPNEQVTRAQVAAFLHRAAGKPSAQTALSFNDVNRSAYYADAVRWAAEQGITTGTSASSYSPDKGCTRAEIATFLYRSRNLSDGTPAPTPIEQEKPVSEMPDYEENKKQTKPEIVVPDEQDEKREPHETPCVEDADGAYNAIYEAALSFTSDIDLRPYHLDWQTFLDVCEKAIDDAYYRDPDGWYRHFSYDITQKTNDEVAYLTINYSYLNGASLGSKREQYRQLCSTVKDIVAQTIDNSMSDYDKAKALHDYLVLNNEYDMRLYSGNMPHISYTAYGALLEHTSVCAGYALAYEMLLDEAGVPVKYVAGDTTSGKHAWNLVEIDGEWYHVDATWDDPTPDRKGYVQYDYFLRSDNYMSRDHSEWDAPYRCTSTKYDNTTILNDEEQKVLDEQKQHDALVNEICALMQKQMEAMPYQDASSLRNAENLSDSDVSYKICIPADKYEYGAFREANEKLKRENSRADFTICGTSTNQKTDDNQWYFSVFRKDISAELQRREAEASQYIAEQGEMLILELQRAIKWGTEADYYYGCPGFAYEAIEYACDRMNASDYSFDDYSRADLDYILFPLSDSVEIINHRWERQETERWAAVFEQGIRNREGRIVVEVPDQTSADFISWGAVTAFEDGHTVDNLTAGKDYRKLNSSFNWVNGTLTFVVEVEYPSAQQEAAEV